MGEAFRGLSRMGNLLTEKRYGAVGESGRAGEEGGAKPLLRAGEMGVGRKWYCHPEKILRKGQIYLGYFMNFFPVICNVISLLPCLVVYSFSSYTKINDNTISGVSPSSI